MAVLHSYFSLACKILAITLLLIISGQAHGRYVSVNQYYGGHATVYHYGHSTFYKHPNGVVYAKHYNRQTIHDLVGFCRAHRMGTFYWIPNGYYGAIPSHLYRFAHHRFTQHGINVVKYHHYKRYYVSPRYHYYPRYYYTPRHYYHPYGYHRYNRSSGVYFHFRF